MKIIKLEYQFYIPIFSIHTFLGSKYTLLGKVLTKKVVKNRLGCPRSRHNNERKSIIQKIHPFQKADSSLGCSKGQHAQWGEIISGVATAKLHSDGLATY